MKEAKRYEKRTKAFGPEARPIRSLEDLVRHQVGMTVPVVFLFLRARIPGLG